MVSFIGVGLFEHLLYPQAPNFGYLSPISSHGRRLRPDWRHAAARLTHLTFWGEKNSYFFRL
jgi:hypothetical protein